MIGLKTDVKKQRGSVLVIATAGLLLMLLASILAIDVGYVFVVRNELQNAADAAALAGGQGLIVSEDRARELAKEFAQKNQSQGEAVILLDSDITFPRSNVVQVRITRPARTFFAAIFGRDQVNVAVTSAAAAVPALGGTGTPRGGWRPWAIPDQFINTQCGERVRCRAFGQPQDPHNKSNDPNDLCYKNHPCNLADPAFDVYSSPYDIPGDVSGEVGLGDPTGYIAPRDVDYYFDRGEPVRIKIVDSHDRYTGGNFFGLALGGHGGSTYRNNIINGWDGVIHVGDILETEPGNMKGPTRQGIQGLIAQDPTARITRDRDGNVVVESEIYPINESPRVVPIPMFDPSEPPNSGRSLFRVSSIGLFFVEGMNAEEEVLGYFITGRLRGADAGEAPNNTGPDSTGGGGRLAATVSLVKPIE